MSQKQTHKRHSSLFNKGMTLQEYVRRMDLRESNIPTADTYHSHADDNDQQECLYKTTQNFYNVPPKPNITSIKQIEEESYDDSIDQHYQSKNIISTNLKKIGKQSLAVVGDPRKQYRIRNGSFSPYQKNKASFSPAKTQTNKFYKFEETLPKQYLPDSSLHPHFLAGKQPSKSSLNKLKNANKIFEEGMAPKMNHTTSKWYQKEMGSGKLMAPLEKMDLRIQSFKGRIIQNKAKKMQR